jgi:hypothetical protein
MILADKISVLRQRLRGLSSLFRRARVARGKYTPDEARALYEEIIDNTDIVGHGVCGDPSVESAHRLRERTTAIADDYTIEESPSADTDDGPPALRFQVASPWHALIHLSVNNRGWLEGKQGPIRTPLIYRGQRDSRWSVAPSLLRKGTDRHKEEQRLLTFCSIVREALGSHGANRVLPDLGSTEALSDAVLEATAQHYGVKTSLLDFTSDEAVAVWFACQGGSKGDIASVFALPLAVGTLCDLGIFLTHPLALRPYRQHGLFVRDSLDQLKHLLIEIRFPIDPDFRIRRDLLPVDLLPSDEWWDAIVSGLEDESSKPPLLGESSERTKQAVDESFLHMLQMLMELTTFDIMKDASFNYDVIAQIASKNARLLLSCEPYCRSVGKEHFRGTMGQFVVPQMLDHLRDAALGSLLKPTSREPPVDMDIFKKWLPIYRDSYGAILSGVPTDVARRMLELCKASNVNCELHPEGPGIWTVQVKGARAAR